MFAITLGPLLAVALPKYISAFELIPPNSMELGAPGENVLKYNVEVVAQAKWPFDPLQQRLRMTKVIIDTHSLGIGDIGHC